MKPAVQTEFARNRRKLRSSRRTLGLVLCVLLTVAACSPPAEIQIDNARVRGLIGGQDKTVAYMDVQNRTSTPITLIGASAQTVRAMEIHTTRMDDGVMRMRRLTSVEIPPGETIRFEPGGRHLMLFGVISLNEDLPIRLAFADGSVREINFERIAPGEQ